MLHVQTVGTEDRSAAEEFGWVAAVKRYTTDLLGLYKLESLSQLKLTCSRIITYHDLVLVSPITPHNSPKRLTNRLRTITWPTT
jgi:hypothetical protein